MNVGGVEAYKIVCSVGLRFIGQFMKIYIANEILLLIIISRRPPTITKCNQCCEISIKLATPFVARSLWYYIHIVQPLNMQ